jgi:hypothetical protein
LVALQLADPDVHDPAVCALANDTLKISIRAAKEKNLKLASIMGRQIFCFDILPRYSNKIKSVFSMKARIGAMTASTPVRPDQDGTTTG